MISPSPDPAEILLQARSVDKTFAGPVDALREVSFDLYRGEFVAIVGPSGCGKSTLLRLTAGLDQPTAGDLQLAGLPAEQARRSRLRLSFVFQDPTLLAWRSVEGNIGLPLELARLDRQQIRARTAESLRMVQLADFAGSRPSQLSGGMRMRVSLARALVTHPELLLLDEPFAALDDLTRHRLNEELLALWMRDRWAALFVTHNVAEAAFLSTRILLMSPRPGRIETQIDVPFEWPRSVELRADPRFARFVAEVGRMLQRAAA